MHRFLQNRKDDLRYAVRTMRNNLGFTAIATLSLALGIGANTAIFSLVDALLLKMLPVGDPQRLYVVTGASSGRTSTSWTYPDYRALRDYNRGFSGLIAYSGGSQASGFAMNSTGETRTELANALLVSGNYFDVLGVFPAIGTLFNNEHDRSMGAAPYMVLSRDFWKRRFGSDASVIGKTARVNGYPLTIIGVSGAGFRGVEVGVAPDFFVPIVMRSEVTGRAGWNNRNNSWLYVVGRLKSGTSIAQVESELSVISKQQEEQERRTAANPRFVNTGMPVKLLPGAQGYSGLRNRLSQPLIVLMIIVGVVLLIACANVANLLLARAAARRHEMAVRLAIGAGRGRIAGQLLTESVLLGIMGGVAGLLFAFACVRGLVGLIPLSGGMPVSLDVTPDLRLFAFTLAVSFVTGILFGLAPALEAIRPDPVTTLREETGSTVSRARGYLRKSLVVLQVALSLMLLVGAGLFVRSLGNLNALETGFRRERTLIVDLDPTRNGYTVQRARDYYERLRQNVEGIPGVRSAALARIIPLAGGRWNQFVAIPGYDYKEGERRVIDMNAVTPRFFETLGISIVAGRDFRTEDSPAFTPAPPTGPPPPNGALRPEELAGPHAAIVNESLVKKYFAGRSPVGSRLALTERYREEGSYEIVGVVKDVRYFGLRQPTEPMVYVPAWRQGSGSTALCIRASAGAETVIEAVRRQANAIDSAIPILRARTMEQNVDSNILQEKLVATLAGFFGLLALLLAAVGLYGVMAHSVARRTREIGIRMALGAAGRAVLWMVLRDALIMVTLGAAIGIPAALALARFASSLLFGIQAGDPANALLATLFLGGVAVVASYLPARRASRIDPGIALRYQ